MMLLPVLQINSKSFFGSATHIHTHAALQGGKTYRRITNNASGGFIYPGRWHASQGSTENLHPSTQHLAIGAAVL